MEAAQAIEQVIIQTENPIRLREPNLMAAECGWFICEGCGEETADNELLVQDLRVPMYCDACLGELGQNVMTRKGGRFYFPNGIDSGTTAYQIKMVN